MKETLAPISPLGMALAAEKRGWKNIGECEECKKLKKKIRKLRAELKEYKNAYYGGPGRPY